MPGDEIKLLHDDGAETVYAIVRDMAGQWYVGVTPGAFVVGSWATYAIALTEISAGASGTVMEVGTFPAVAAGHYYLDVYVRATANPLQTDYRAATYLMHWNGTSLTASLPADVSALATADALAVVDAIVDAIKLKTDNIGAADVTVTSLITPGGDVTIHAGDDYLADDGRALTWTITGYIGPDLTDATAVMRLIPRARYDLDETAADLEAEAVLTIDGDPPTITVEVELTAAQTAGLATSPPNQRPNYIYQIVATTAATSTVRILEGKLTARKGIETPAA